MYIYLLFNNTIVGKKTVSEYVFAELVAVVLVLLQNQENHIHDQELAG